jgi:hypothetical protein
MRCRLQPNDLRLEEDRAVILVVRQVIDGGFDRHALVSLVSGHEFDFPERSLAGFGGGG